MAGDSFVDFIFSLAFSTQKKYEFLYIAWYRLYFDGSELFGDDIWLEKNGDDVRMTLANDKFIYLELVILSLLKHHKMKNPITTPRGIFNIRTYGNQSNPPLVLLHGWPQTSYCWHHTAPYLKDFYLIAPDLRGMGDSNRELDIKLYTKDEMSKDIFAIMDELGINQFHLGGHDWGGAIVQEMAFLHPERIKKLIIINMLIINNKKGQEKASEVLVKYLFRSSWYQFFMSIKDFPEALLSGKEDVWVRFFSRGISNPIPEDAIEEYIRCYKILNTITTAANIYRNISKDRARWKEYEGKKLNIPTKIIHGILDPVIIKEYLEGADECFSELEISHLKGGHFIVDEQPEQVGNEITKYLLS